MQLRGLENRAAMLSDGINYHLGIYGSSEAREVHQFRMGVSLDNIEVRSESD
jgi:poly-D-alanine transfer protein DltD